MNSNYKNSYYIIDSQINLFKKSKLDVIDLCIVSLDRWNVMQGALSTLEERLLQAQLFSAKIGHIGLISNDKGELRKIYVGAGREDTGTALAAIMPRLPEGIYQPDVKLTHTDKIMWAMSQYQFGSYKSEFEKKLVRQLVVSAVENDALQAEVSAIFMVRDLINTPTSDMGPEILGQKVYQLAKTYEADVQEWVGDALLENNFPAIHAVGRAASQAPRMMILRWGNKQNPGVSLVGKGVCFDTGGLDLKNSGGMRWMKKDMGGAAHVLGLAHWIMTLQLPIYLQVYIPIVENAVAGNAYRPGDVLCMRNKMTVEIDNTDAEGRLILADALVKACEDKPDLLIQFATLTGAARIAVGTEIAAFFSTNNTIAQAVQTTADFIQDPVWRLPLYAPYQSLLNSYIADMTNSSAGAYAGAIVAALFMQKFVDPNIDWLHFDMMAWNVSSKPGKPEGGEAMGLRAIGHYLIQRFGVC